MRMPNWPAAGVRELELLRQVLDSPQWGGFHPIVTQFEQDFASFQHCAQGVSAANGTVTLEMLLHCAGLGAGDEVIVPAISFISTATAVSRVGATPVFVDLEPYSFNMDPDRAERAVNSKTRAIVVVHFGGSMVNLDRFTSLARDKNLLLIEDAAHAHGSEWRGRRAGSFGLAGSFSFQNGKVLTAGEGGMVTTNDAAFAGRLRSFANQGRLPGEDFFFHYSLGSNFRLTALQAAVLTAQFEKLPGEIKLRTANASLLYRLLSDVPGLRLQEVPAEVTANSWYLLLGRIEAGRYGETRDEFHQRLTAAGVPCTPFYPHALYGNPLYQRGGCRVEPCPNAEACVRDAFWLPHRVLMADEETLREVAAVMAGRATSARRDA